VNIAIPDVILCASLPHTCPFTSWFSEVSDLLHKTLLTTDM